METIKNIWQWLSGSHVGYEKPVYNPHFETVIPEFMVKKYLDRPIKPCIGCHKISNMRRYR